MWLVVVVVVTGGRWCVSCVKLKKKHDVKMFKNFWRFSSKGRHNLKANRLWILSFRKIIKTNGVL